MQLNYLYVHILTAFMRSCAVIKTVNFREWCRMLFSSPRSCTSVPRAGEKTASIKVSAVQFDTAQLNYLYVYILMAFVPSCAVIKTVNFREWCRMLFYSPRSCTSVPQAGEKTASIKVSAVQFDTAQLNYLYVYILMAFMRSCAVIESSCL